MATSLNIAPVVDVVVKNTFIDIMEPATDGAPRRCSSVPRSWMPGHISTLSPCILQKLDKGEDATTASDKETLTPSSDLDSLTGSDKDMYAGATTPSTISEFDSLECRECGPEFSIDSAAPEEVPTFKPTVEVKLLDFVQDAAAVRHAVPEARTKLRATAQPFASVCAPSAVKLRATAQPFASVRAPPAGIQKVIQAAKAVLECDPSVACVQMVEAAMGGTWTMTAHLRSDAPKKNPRYYLSATKKTLLASAEYSRDVYVLGYDVKPFSKIDKCSFSTTLAAIPDAQQNVACWDSYKNGFCPRRITCRWAHPSETHVMRLVIRIQHNEAVGVHEEHEEE